MISLSEYKAEFKDRDGIHFNNAGMAPLSNRVAMRATQVITELNQNGAFMDAVYLPLLQACRKNLAKFLGAEDGEVSYFPNCSSALSQVAFSLNLNVGDSVITLAQEYASNLYPWKVACENAGAKLIALPSGLHHQIQMEALLDAVQPGVQCVAISWVQFQTGAIVDLKRLGDHCHGVGAKLVVDGIQGIGQLPISFRDLPVDALVGASHKWLCGLNGQGFLAVKNSWLSELSPILVGSGTFNRFGTFADLDAKMETSARKFEPGGLNFIGMFALDEAIALQTSVGEAVIAQEISRLVAQLRKGLLELSKKGLTLATPVDQIGGITSFLLPLEAEAKLTARCREEKVALVKRGVFMRTAIHAFNTDDEVNRVLQLIDQAL